MSLLARDEPTRLVQLIKRVRPTALAVCNKITLEAGRAPRSCIFTNSHFVEGLMVVTNAVVVFVVVFGKYTPSQQGP